MAVAPKYWNTFSSHAHLVTTTDVKSGQGAGCLKGSHILQSCPSSYQDRCQIWPGSWMSKRGSHILKSFLSSYHDRCQIWPGRWMSKRITHSPVMSIQLPRQISNLAREMDVQEDHTFSSHIHPVTTTNIKSGQVDGRPRRSHILQLCPSSYHDKYQIWPERWTSERISGDRIRP